MIRKAGLGAGGPSPADSGGRAVGGRREAAEHDLGIFALLWAVVVVLGPVHGFAYLATIAIAFLLPLGSRTRLLTLIPAIGGLLALSRTRRVSASRHPSRSAERALTLDDDRTEEPRP